MQTFLGQIEVPINDPLQCVYRAHAVATALTQFTAQYNVQSDTVAGPNEGQRCSEETVLFVYWDFVPVSSLLPGITRLLLTKPASQTN